MRTYLCSAVVGLFCLGNSVLPAGVTESPERAASAAGVDGDVATVASIITEAGIERGVCSLLGGRDPAWALGLARQKEMLVHVWAPDRPAALTVLAAADAAALAGKSIVVEPGTLDRLPYADHVVDALIVAETSGAELDALDPAEALRVVRPRGVVILRESLLTGERLDKWSRTPAVLRRVSGSGTSGWIVLTRPAIEGVGRWSHWEHGPDNNPVSEDQVIKAPYMTQWLGTPFYIAMPAISTAAGGRIFIAMGHIAHHEREEPWLNTLLAHNGYNGAVLWQKKLPDGYLAHRSAFVATDDTFYMIAGEGNACVMLDPETGDEKGRIRIPEARGYWKWMVLDDGVLYVLSGPQPDPAETTIVRSERTHWSWGELSKGYYEERVPWGFGHTLVAYDMAARKVLWVHEEGQPIDSRAMTMGGGRVYLYCPDAHLRCLDAKTGRPAWTNQDPHVRELIEQKGRGLVSTPGFRSMCYSLYTPDVVFYEAQTHMNVVAISTKDGCLLWSSPKTSSNPNMIYVDGKLIVGVGESGLTQMIEPLTGDVIKDLGFTKRSCARLTATSDSFFCRGWPEGLTRYDRATGKVLFNGAVRPSCNDGVIAAHGLLYMGPWACDCNLSLMGRLVLCSAGAFDFRSDLAAPDRLQPGDGDLQKVADLPVDERDWATYRANASHSSSTPVAVSDKVVPLWDYRPRAPFRPTAPTAAGGLIFLGGDDGRVRAIDALSGRPKWSFIAAGAILQPPTIWQGRAFFGAGDGYVYALEAATGRLLWRFRAAPVERRIMVYESLASTWPVNSGVIVRDGVVYAAAGIIDYDGTYVYALDAVTGKPVWQNDSSGHLDPELRKGVSAQGTLTVAEGRLWMAGGNVISPAAYDLGSGRYVGPSPGNGSPQANRGEEVGVFRDRYVIAGGRLRFSARDNTVNPGRFMAQDARAQQPRPPQITLATGKVPPAWDDGGFARVNGLRRPLEWLGAEPLQTYIDRQDPKAQPEVAWTAQNPQNSDTVSIALASNTVVTVTETRLPGSLQPRWQVQCSNRETGAPIWRQGIGSAASVGGTLIDRDGRVVIVLQDGGVACLGGLDALNDYVSYLAQQEPDAEIDHRPIVDRLIQVMRSSPDARIQAQIKESLERLGYNLIREGLRDGVVMDWKLIGPVPWSGPGDVERTFIGEPQVDPTRSYELGGRTLEWREFQCEDPAGVVDLVPIFGQRDNVAVFAYAEFRLDRPQDITIRIGSDDGFKCWLNGQEVGLFDGMRGYRPEASRLRAHAVAGVNRLLLKVTQFNLGWVFSTRLTDREGRPIDLNVKR